MNKVVHVAHSVRVGRNCSLIACSEVSDRVALGDGAWVGPSSAINPQVRIGDHAYLGTASIVSRDIAGNALACGSPAKVHVQSAPAGGSSPRTTVERHALAAGDGWGPATDVSRRPELPPRWDGAWDEPVFVLTADQDWAPAWASERLLDLAEADRLPLHVFRTNPCPVLDEAFAAGRITQGWHPNFLPGSSHGDSPEAVVAYCAAQFPSCRTARAHCFMEHTMAWDALAAAGIVADSQLPTYFQDGLAPLLHASGIWRLPVYFEDDIFFRYFPDDLELRRLDATLFGRGLKILNFHPTFVAANVPSLRHYEGIKARWFAPGANLASLVHPGRGTRVVFEELVTSIRAHGFGFQSFEALVDRLPAARRSSRLTEASS